MEYELDFRMDELDFALGAVRQTYRDILGDYRVEDVPQYDVTARPNMDLSEPWREHCALARLIGVSGE
ncbi:hypothetical protein [Plantibacter sp. MMLR14_011]|uniref:hypothetical protein n=1 Tax=Plantibacter sp. MMLR14_011 TaxID=1898746 RepID=UPI0008DC5E11|nr:hypothetical protein [Plantibacter sp. MMLR14_011]OII41029.1 hypothetical protein BIU99_04240 [Plantibacter sp. MMLR14_011]